MFRPRRRLRPRFTLKGWAIIIITVYMVIRINTQPERHPWVTQTPAPTTTSQR